MNRSNIKFHVQNSDMNVVFIECKVTVISADIFMILFLWHNYVASLGLVGMQHFNQSTSFMLLSQICIEVTVPQGTTKPSAFGKLVLIKNMLRVSIQHLHITLSHYYTLKSERFVFFLKNIVIHFSHKSNIRFQYMKVSTVFSFYIDFLRKCYFEESP